MSEIDAAKSQAITFACDVSICANRIGRPKKKSFSIIEKILIGGSFFCPLNLDLCW